MKKEKCINLRLFLYYSCLLTLLNLFVDILPPGLSNSSKAFAADNLAPVVSSIAVTSTGTVRNGGVASLKAYVSDPNGDSMTYAWTATEGSISGTSTTARWTAPATGAGTATIKLVAKDSVGAEGSKEISVAYAENSAPVVSSIAVTSTGTVRSGGVASLKAYVSDPNNDSMTYTWTATDGTISGTSTTARWTAPATGAGTATIKLVAKDSVGAEGSKEISVDYAENSAPVVSSIAVTSTGTVRSGGVASLKAYVSDPNGDAMTYTWSATDGTISGTSTTARWTAPATGAGTVTIKLVAKDSVGAEGSKEISVAYAENSAPVISSIAKTSIREVRNGGVASLKAYVSDPNGDSMTYTWSATDGTISGTGTTARWTAPATGTGTVTIKVVAKDSVGAEGSKEISVAYDANATPIVSSVVVTSAGIVRNGGVAYLKAYVSDPNGDSMTYTWSATDGTISGTGTTARWTAPATGAGTVTIKLVAKDSVGAEGSKEIIVPYVVNSAPVVSSISASPMVSIRNAGIVSLKAIASDRNCDRLSYIWTASEGTITASGAIAKWTAPESGKGTATIKVVAKDTAGAEGFKEISVAYTENSAPVVSSIAVTSTGTVRNGGVASLKAYVSDPNNDSMTYTWTATDGTISGTSTTARWTAPATGAGTSIIKLVAKDSVGAEGSKEISITYAENSAPVVSSISVNPTGTVKNNAIAALTAYASDANGDVLTYVWSATAGSITGSGKTAKWTAPASGTGTVTVKVVAKDSPGAEGSKELTISYGSTGNTAPVVSSLSYAPTGTTAAGGTKSLSAIASDPENDTLTYTWTATAGTVTGSGSGSTATWTAPATGSGSATIKVTAKDPSGLEGSKEVTITYAANGTPVVSDLSATPAGNAKCGDVKTLTATATDPENDTLTYTWTATAGTVSGTGTTATWTAPATGSGSATIKVTAKDPSNLEGSKEITIAFAPNNAPVLSEIAVSPSGTAKAGAVKTLTATATDADGDTLTYAWTADAGTVSGTGATISWTAPASGAGKAVVTLTVTDTSSAQAVKTAEINYDAQAPTAPAGLTVSPYSPTAIYLSWTASTDNIGVTGYRIFRNGTLYDTTGTDVTWTDTNLTPDTQYCYEICAIDAAQNASANTGSQCAKTLAKPVFGRLNDTGITTWSDNTSSTLTTAQPTFPGQDADYGRDKTANNDVDGYAGFSFTKIGADGEELPVLAAQWSAVRDNVTGLMWEMKTDDDGLHDKDWTYSWYDPNSTRNGGAPGVYNGGNSGGTISYSDTYHFVQAVNAEIFCGYSDWRMPTLKELKSIISFDRRNPSIESSLFFVNTKSFYYYSSSPYASNINYAWAVQFGNGDDFRYDKSSAMHVRLVRRVQ